MFARRAFTPDSTEYIANSLEVTSGTITKAHHAIRARSKEDPDLATRLASLARMIRSDGPTA